MTSQCPKCEAGIITTHDPKDPTKVDTFTVCENCNGTGVEREMEWPSPFYLVLLIPNFLLFCGGA